jgi:hypothetical protein
MQDPAKLQLSYAPGKVCRGKDLNFVADTILEEKRYLPPKFSSLLTPER